MKKAIWGLMAEFENPEQLLAAAKSARAEGYRKLDAYSPFPIEHVWEALGHHHNRLPLIVLAGGVLGALTGFFMQYYLSVVEYPINVGGRPLNSWPSFIPITFEVTVLFAALAAVLGMIAMNGLPTPYHPVFNAERFALASSNRFFLCIESGDPNFDEERTRKFLEGLGSFQVTEVRP